MFYEELYPVLGKLFYSLAAVDGKVQPTEKEALERLIRENWKPLEGSVDEYGTDKANLIYFSFDYGQAEGSPMDGLELLKAFYAENRSAFTPSIVKNILQTGEAIVSAYRGGNKKEESLLNDVKELFF